MLLTGAHLADGTATPLRAADVLVEDGHITAVETPGTIPPDALPSRDLTGLVLAPGFIDVHSHADNAPLLPHDDTTKILQGITTEIVGNCGFSLAPTSSDHALSALTERLFPPLELTWSGFADLLTTTDQAGYVTNHCPLVGHSTLRVAAMGMSEHTPDDRAERTMRAGLDEAMTAGAFGLSSGLIYPPALFARTEELSTLAEVLGGDGIYVTHMRDEGSALLESITEALRIGAVAGRTHLSHLKAAGPGNWGAVPHALEKIDAARADGHRIAQDVYPYTASSTMLTATLPAEFLAGDERTLLNRLTSSTGRDELAEAFAAGRPGWQHHGGGWDHVLVATTASHTDEGRTLAHIAAERGVDPVDALIEILVREKLRASMVHFSMHEHDLEAALADSHTMIGSDGLPPGTGGKPHPRLFGTFPRLLGRYSRDRAILDLPEAVRRMTALPAHEFRIPARGRIAPGYVADLVAFDPATVTDVGDYQDPAHPPHGIPWVCQAGRTVVDNGAHLGGRHGSRLTPAS